MEEIIFLVEESDEGGYIAKGIGVSIFSEAETESLLKESVKDAVRCHFDDDKKRLIRLHWVKDEVLAL
ncbi:MAG: 2-oxoisovalerate dehydrogenase [Bacteroidia bacterium]|nr:2-oxoisovalerate dehydrogenase [Bacteroidia bacterium]